MKISSATPNLSHMENDSSGCKGANHSRHQILAIRMIHKMLLWFKIFVICMGCYLRIAHDPWDINLILPFSLTLPESKRASLTTRPTQSPTRSLISDLTHAYS